MTIGITSPLYITNSNHVFFLNGTTKSIRTTYKYIWIPVENYVALEIGELKYEFEQQPSQISVIKGRQPQSVSKAWNDGIQKGIDLNCDYILVCNDDVIFRTDAIDKLVTFAEAHPEFVMWTMGDAPDLFQLNINPTDENYSEHPNFSGYMVKKDFFSHAGRFDENFYPGYFEDNDMHARLALSNKKSVIYGGSRFFHFASRTVNSDPDYKAKMPPMFNKSREYFAKKWGVTPVNEVDEMRKVYYKHPFNDPTKTLFDW